MDGCDMVSPAVPFNRPYMTGRELTYIAQAHGNAMLAGDGPFTRKCQAWIENRIGAHRALLTHSCTAALEMCALLLDLRAGDEVIMPSFTFVSTANAFALRGAVPVFVDIRSDTLNIDETLIEPAITKRTRAIVVVHYAGMACAMGEIMAIASRHGLVVIEDAAQAILSSYQSRSLGSIGHLAALSFHETKNITSGEGGALLINDPDYVPRAEVIREKGTNRSRFFRGEVDKYTWCDLGSSFLPGELVAAFLWAQFEEAEQLTEQRRALWNNYHQGLASLEQAGYLRRPVIPTDATPNGHLYYLLLAPAHPRGRVIETMAHQGVNAVFHYVPLHLSPAGRKYGRAVGQLPVTCDTAERLLRLPMWIGLEGVQQRVVAALDKALR